MVCSRLPECLITLHSLVTDQDILHRIVEGMSHMELSCNIRRRHYDRERLFALASSSLRVSVEIFVVQPFLVQTVLNVRRIVGLFQFFHGLLLKTLSTCFFFVTAKMWSSYCFSIYFFIISAKCADSQNHLVYICFLTTAYSSSDW